MSFKIVPVPPKMEKFFGCGKMLHPSPEQVKRWLPKIPVGKCTSLQSLGAKLANEAGANVCCPMRLGNVIKQLADQANLDHPDLDMPFWRVLRNDGRLIKAKEQVFWSELLSNEGHELATNKKGELLLHVSPNSLW